MTYHKYELMSPYYCKAPHHNDISHSLFYTCLTMLRTRYSTTLFSHFINSRSRTFPVLHKVSGCFVFLVGAPSPCSERESTHLHTHTALCSPTGSKFERTLESHLMNKSTDSMRLCVAFPDSLQCTRSESNAVQPVRAAGYDLVVSSLAACAFDLVRSYSGRMCGHQHTPFRSETHNVGQNL